MPKTKKRAVLSQSLIPGGQSRWGSMGLGFAIQAVFVTVLAVIPLLIPNAIQFLPHYWVTPIEAPVVRPWRPQPKRSPAPVSTRPKLAEEMPEKEELPKPAMITPVLSSPIKKQVSVHTSAPERPQIAENLPNQNPPVIGTASIPILQKPREEVHTGGFGDPNSVPVSGETRGSPNIAQLGNYENAPGYGNGGSRGSRGHGFAREGMFSDGIATGSAPRIRPVATAVSRTRPIQILFKPKPKYTHDALVAKVEGDVLLEVLFRSTGEVEVLRVVTGLGHGLDESAKTAAREIRFQPALRDGEPVDFSAVVHITFALAY